MEEKPCIKCGSPERYKDGRCAPCHREYNRRYHEAHREKARESRRRHREAHPIKQANCNYMRKYGISFDQVKAMWEDQEKRCKICWKSLEFPHKHTHVDHDHETGKVRGILCRTCNTVFVRVLDDIKQDVVFLEFLFRYVGAL